MADIKKQLKQLQLGDWSSFIEDVNYNFSVLISSPLFVGAEGLPGKAGNPGSVGLRGSRWFYIDLEKFKIEFPEDNLVGEYQITLDYLNNKLIKLDTRKRLLKCFDTDIFVSGDIIISNSKILMIDLMQERSIIDTGNVINSSTDIIYEDIIKQLTKIIDDKMKEINESIELSFMTLFETQAKNYSDSSGYINNEILNSSIYDIKVADSKIGVKVPSHKLLAPREMLMDEDMTVTQIIGSPLKYHKIIQRTLSWDQSQTNNTTSEFGPSRKSNPSAVILQNDYENGLMIGHRDEENFTQFGRIYMTKTNGQKNLTITSPNVSKHYVSHSDIKLYDNHIDIISELINLKGNVVANGNITMLTGTAFEHTLIGWKDKQVSIGSQSLKSTTYFNSSSHIFEDTKYLNCDFLSIVNKELTGTKFNFDANTDYKVIGNATNMIPNTLLIKNLVTATLGDSTNIWAKIKSLEDALALEITNRVNADNALNTRITNLIAGSTYNMKTLETYLVGLINTTDANRKTYIDNQITAVKSDYNTQFTNLKAYVDNINTQLTTRINTTNTNLTNETNARVAADNAIRGGYTGSMYTLNQAISTETTARINEDTAIRGGYSNSMMDLYKLIQGMGVPGQIIPLYVKSTKTVSQVINDLFDTTGRGKVGVTYETPIGIANNINLSNLYVCNGKTAPDLQDVVEVMPLLSSGNKIGDKVGSNTVTLTTNHLPTFVINIPSQSFPISLPSHRHSLSSGWTSYDGSHVHNVTEAGDHKLDKVSQIRIPKSNTDYTTPAGSVYPFACTSNGAHSHSLYGYTAYDGGGYVYPTIPANNITYNGNNNAIDIRQPSVYVIKCMIGLGIK